MSSLGPNNNRKPSGDNERSRGQQSGRQDSRRAPVSKGQHRNRLIGAVVLIALGVILIPALFTSGDDSDEADQGQKAPLVSPSGGNGSQSLSIETAPGTSANGDDVTGSIASEAGQDGQVPSDGTETTDPAAQDDPSLSVAQSTNPSLVPTFGDEDKEAKAGEEFKEGDEDQQSIAQSTASKEAQKKASEESKSEKTESKPTLQAKEKPKKPAEKPKSSNHIADKDRTDDGSRARALLEGRSPETSSVQSASKVTSGNYNVQLASVSSADDARKQRDKLKSSGVSNAFIQAAKVNGRTTYRIKVGPFKSKESAQAAQTRLRALNFSNSIITK